MGTAFVLAWALRGGDDVATLSDTRAPESSLTPVPSSAPPSVSPRPSTPSPSLSRAPGKASPSAVPARRPGARPAPSGPVSFARNSFWYASITGAPVAGDSAGIVANVAEQASAQWRPVINTKDFSAPIYVTDASTPRQDVAWNNCQNKGHDEPGLRKQLRNVPIPAHAVPAGGTDKEVIFYSPAEDTLWELWVAEKKKDGSWSACWGGKLTGVSKGHGAFPHPYGVTAAGLSMYGGTILASELQAGRIDHAIGLALPNTAAWPNVSWPANRTDGYNPENKTVPTQGQRLRLDPSIDVDSLKLHPVAKTIAKAAQKHGFIVWDTAGAVSLRAENPLSYTSAGKPDPYDKLFGETPNWAILEGFPWDKLQALPKDHGKP